MEINYKNISNNFISSITESLIDALSFLKYKIKEENRDKYKLNIRDKADNFSLLIKMYKKDGKYDMDMMLSETDIIDDDTFEVLFENMDKHVICTVQCMHKELYDSIKFFNNFITFLKSLKNIPYEELPIKVISTDIIKIEVVKNHNITFGFTDKIKKCYNDCKGRVRYEKRK